jgi:hypothetical protein
VLLLIQSRDQLLLYQRHRAAEDDGC